MNQRVAQYHYPKNTAVQMVGALQEMVELAKPVLPPERIVALSFLQWEKQVCPAGKHSCAALV